MTKPIKVSADMILHFLNTSTYEESLRVLPELTREQYDGLRSGTMRLTGDSDALQIEVKS